MTRWLEPAAVAGGSSSSMDPHNPVGPMGAALGIGEIERRERGDDEPREE